MVRWLLGRNPLLLDAYIGYGGRAAAFLGDW